MAPWGPSKGGILAGLRKARPAFPSLEWGPKCCTKELDDVATVAAPSRRRCKSNPASKPTVCWDSPSRTNSPRARGGNSPARLRRRRQPCTNAGVNDQCKQSSWTRYSPAHHAGTKDIVMPALAEEMHDGQETQRPSPGDSDPEATGAFVPFAKLCSVKRVIEAKESRQKNVCSLAQSCWRGNGKNRTEALDSSPIRKKLELPGAMAEAVSQPHSRRHSTSGYSDQTSGIHIQRMGTLEQRGLNRIKAMDPNDPHHPMKAYKLATSYNMTPNQVADARRTFDRYDSDGKGTLDPREFKELIHGVLIDVMPETVELPEDMFQGIDESADGEVDFEEFLRWITTQSFREEVMIPIEQQKIRAIARKFNLNITEVEAVKRRFDRFDDDGNGTIDQHEFKQLLTQLLRTPKHTELPHKRVEGFWREIDADGSGTVEFEEFLPWYMRYFPLDGGIAASPIESFYASVRGKVHMAGAVSYQSMYVHAAAGSRPHTS